MGGQIRGKQSKPGRPSSACHPGRVRPPAPNTNRVRATNRHEPAVLPSNHLESTSPYSGFDYDSERRILIDGEYRVCESFNKYLITIISGTLALTVTFIEKIAQHPVSVRLLIVGYAALTLALVCALAAFLLEPFAWRHQLKILDDIHEGKLTVADAQRDPRVVARWSQGLLIAAFVVFAIGLVFTIVFICLNISILMTAVL